MHGNTVAHGVTVLESGIRYGLFFLEVEEEVEENAEKKNI
jgi:hypothetical protein